ncbi:MAG: hypothetical protein U1E21_22745 [Reyranellaceae bacterium]
MEAIVGPWSKALDGIGRVAAVLGNHLSWLLVSAEIVHSAGRHKTTLAILAAENVNGAPVAGTLYASGTRFVMLPALLYVPGRSCS